jgi:hypothetical protein
MAAGPIGRRFRVRYAFRGVVAETNEEFPLRDTERDLARGLVSHRILGLFGGPAIAMLTDQRRCIVVHYLFRFDQGYELPRGSLLDVRPTRIFPTVTFHRLTHRGAQGLEAIDIADVKARSAGTLLMGPSLRLQRLLEAPRDSWGPDCPKLVE